MSLQVKELATKLAKEAAEVREIQGHFLSKFSLLDSTDYINLLESSAQNIAGLIIDDYKDVGSYIGAFKKIVSFFSPYYTLKAEFLSLKLRREVLPRKAELFYIFDALECLKHLNSQKKNFSRILSGKNKTDKVNYIDELKSLFIHLENTAVLNTSDSKGFTVLCQNIWLKKIQEMQDQREKYYQTYKNWGKIVDTYLRYGFDNEVLNSSIQQLELMLNGYILTFSREKAVTNIMFVLSRKDIPEYASYTGLLIEYLEQTESINSYLYMLKGKDTEEAKASLNETLMENMLYAEQCLSC